jgi:hypothetical protein
MGKFTHVKKRAINLYRDIEDPTSQTFTFWSKQIAGECDVEYDDNFRKRLYEWVNYHDYDDNDLDNMTDTDTNQYTSLGTKGLSALKENGQIMSIDEYCTSYGIPRGHVKTYKLVTHTGVPYYNIASSNVEGSLDIFNEEFIDMFIAKIADYVPVYPNYLRGGKSYKDTDDENLMVIDSADIHMGKLALAYESSEEYNIEIATQRVIEGFHGILNKAKNFDINKIVLVIGNDVLHFDNARTTTTSGTFQDSCTSLPNAFNVALELYIKLVESVMDTYDVDVIYNPSNHDYMSGWMLARSLECWFRTCDNITFDTTMNHRKYYQYGVNMICTSHGDGAKMDNMPMLMAHEAPMMWATTKYRYVYLHHIHHKQVTKFQSAKDYIGVTVEYLRSPSSSDRWHSDNGYVGAKKAIEAFIHSKLYGQIARITHLF